jgi:hypothetical protein
MYREFTNRIIWKKIDSTNKHTGQVTVAENKVNLVDHALDVLFILHDMATSLLDEVTQINTLEKLHPILMLRCCLSYLKYEM